MFKVNNEEPERRSDHIISNFLKAGRRSFVFLIHFKHI